MAARKHGNAVWGLFAPGCHNLKFHLKRFLSDMGLLNCMCAIWQKAASQFQSFRAALWAAAVGSVVSHRAEEH